MKLDELRALLEKAHSGPWVADSFHSCDSTTPPVHIVNQNPLGQSDQDFFEVTEADAALIAAMHSALPDLLRVVEAAITWNEAREAFHKYQSFGTGDRLRRAEEPLLKALEPFRR